MDGLKRDEKGKLVKGTAPGPGRPQGTPNFTTLFREAVKKVAKANNIEEAEVEYDLVIKAISEAKKGKYQYHKDIFDRVYGKSEDNINLNGDVTINVVKYGDTDTSSV